MMEEVLRYIRQHIVRNLRKIKKREGSRFVNILEYNKVSYSLKSKEVLVEAIKTDLEKTFGIVPMEIIISITSKL